ncbi:MAG: hypothetical protein ACLSVD_13240 [Eggerthellaceae bacterium]
MRVSSYEQCALRLPRPVRHRLRGRLHARPRRLRGGPTDADRDRVRFATPHVCRRRQSHRRVDVLHVRRAPLELAERTKMQVARVRMEDGERIATLRPTCFLEEAAPQPPSP